MSALEIYRKAGEKWNAGNLEGYLELYDENCVVHGYAGLEPGVANLRTFYQVFLTAFPGCQLVFEDDFESEDRVACRFTIHGKHDGSFQGIPPTGRAVTIPGITILRFENDKCVERWSQADFLGLMIQLGAIPAP